MMTADSKPDVTSAATPWREPEFWALCGVAAALLMIMGMLGMLSSGVTLDTPSYFVPAASSNPWGEMRHPLYGGLAAWLGGSASAPGHVALAQGLLHVIASLILYIGARAGNVGRAGALALAGVALLSQSGLYHLRLLVPEAPAIACLLIAFGCALAASRPGSRFALLLLPTMLAAGASYLLRPSFLPVIVTIPVLWWLFAARNGQTRLAARAFMLAVAVATPFLLQSAARQILVGDFNIVSFGGYQMSAMAGFMLTPEVVDGMAEPARSTARAVLAAREAGEQAGRVARTPLNSVGERSFVSAALGYFDIYARTYDELLWNQIVKLLRAGETWVDFNRRLMNFSLSTIAAAPVRYLAWVVGATSRLIGRMIVTNATMLLALAVLLVLSVPAVMRRTTLGAARADLQPVCAIALAWVASTAPLIVLVTFPATRYIDTASLLLAAPPALLAIALMQGLRASRQPDEARKPDQ